QQPVFERRLVHERRDVEFMWQQGFAVARVDQFYAEQEAPTSYLPHHLGACQRCFQLIAQSRPPLPYALDETSADQNVEDGQPDSTGKGRPVPRVAKVELARAFLERFVDV